MATRLSDLALAPALRLSTARLKKREADYPVPAGPPRAHAPGLDVIRILIVGDGVACGVGVLDHDLALPGSVARAVAALTGRGADVDLIADRQLPLASVVSALTEINASRYDAIVVVAGSDEALLREPVSRWQSALAASLNQIDSLVSPATAVLVCGIPETYAQRSLPRSIARLSDAHARVLNASTREICARSGLAVFVPLLGEAVVPPEEGPSATVFAWWADSIAQRLVSQLVASDAKRVESARIGSEHDRQAAVDRLHLDPEVIDPSLARIVRTARRVFGTKTALFTVLDRDLQLNIARAGSELTQLPRSDSFCQFAIMMPGGMVVEDASLDPRFSENPLVTGDPHIRFYAGFPVDSPDGERLGALCVFDSIPRKAEDVDLTLLREFATLVQTELWRHLPMTAHKTSQLRLISRSWTERATKTSNFVGKVAHAIG